MEDYIIRLEQILRVYRRFSQSELKKRGINLSEEQVHVLLAIHKSPGLNQKDIALISGKEPASVTRMLDLLEKKELVIRKSSSKDRRASTVSLTEKGRLQMDEIKPVIEEMRNFGIRKITNNDIETFMAVLGGIERNLT